MFNTYGLRSVNTSTFNLKYHTNYTYPQQARNVIVTVLRIHNLTLNIIGYTQRFSTFSGSARILSGTCICLITLIVGDRNALQGVVIGHWYDEALLTGVAQVARGAIEAFVPYGRTINMTLDVIGTLANLRGEAGNASVCEGCMGYTNHRPYPDPEYPLIARPLYLV